MAKIFLSFDNPVLDEGNPAATVFKFCGLGKISAQFTEDFKKFTTDYGPLRIF